MSLIWHIVAKDARRLLWPTALWLAFGIATVIWFRLAPVNDVRNAAGWFDVMRVWSGLMVAVQTLFALLLTATMVLEDPLQVERAFWPTRPIGGGRLLAAKVLGGLTLFALTPGLVLLPAWLLMGFGPGAASAAAAELILAQAVVVLFAIMVASLTRTLAQFLLVALGVLAVLTMLPVLVAVLGSGELEMAARRWRTGVTQAGALVTLLAVVTHQFLTRNVRRSWAALLVGLALVVLVGAAWRWDPGTAERGMADPRVRIAPAGLFGRVNFLLPTSEQRRHRVPALELRTEQSGAAERAMLPVGGIGELTWAAGERVAVRLDANRRIPDECVLAAARGESLPRGFSTHVKLRRTSDPEAKLLAGAARWEGLVRVAEYRRGAVVALPLEAGAVARSGANRLRVLAVGWPGDGGAATVTIEEHDGWNGFRDGFASVGRRVLGKRESAIDCWVLETQSPSGLHVLATEEVGALILSSLVTGVVRAGLPAGVTAAQANGAVLKKIRFELIGEWAQPVSAGTVVVRPDREP